MRLDGLTVQTLYEKKVLNKRDIVKINIINHLELDWTGVSRIATKFKVSRQYVNKLRKNIGNELVTKADTIKQ